MRRVIDQNDVMDNNVASRGSASLVLLVLLTICILISETNGHAGHEHKGPAPAAPTDPNSVALKSQLERKWGVQDFIRDIDHVKEDLQTVIELSGKGELSQEETLFYMFRMHDFDDNAKLDGLEILAVVQHATGTNLTVEELTGNVDAVLELDGDNDGFLSYPEMKTTLKPQTGDPEPKP